ncbi:hypothetical protein EFK50_14895 [Nocardioides marmoriginsengisoli]|uniref:Htaa domain-containing protein n=1 Tax=Nocardioides marmoriginsengisoli TaxID=661483 RepID=A0A3N0CHV8_9ACTN|nr:hypothetical protein [Nocardioides marmoriginsengisoli]RNL63000.1 hypothetical protein EFK50_14895 [Nocardioides marmoriginsengisoli]
MRRELRVLVLFVVTLLAGAVLAVPSLPAAGADEPPAGAFEVDDALLRWGINNETNNRGAAPGTFNFVSAGKIGNPGEGGQVLTEASAGAKWANGKPAGWKASEGAVRVEKLRPDGDYGLATWAGLQTDRDGTALGGYAVNTKFSDHQVVLSGGTGSVDRTTKTATISWDGDFTIVYYSGYTFFYVSDPVLTVTQGVGRLTGTMSGYSSDMVDLTKWAAVPTRTNVVIADLGTVDLDKDLGFTASPKYLGVKVTGFDQVTSGQYFGSFPQSFMNFLKTVGIGAYFHSSGGSIDRNKVPLDLAVSYAAGSPIIPKTPEGEGENPPVTNTPPPPPPSPPARVVQPPGPVLPQQPAPVAAPAAAPVLAGVQPVATVMPALVLVSAETDDGGAGGPWVAGTALLVLAALIGAFPFLYQRLRRA